MKINKILAVAFLAASAFTSTSFSMDHADMKAAKNPTMVRNVGNQALRDRDAANAALVVERARPAAAAHHVGLGRALESSLKEAESAVAGRAAALQDLLDQTALDAIAAANTYIDSLGADDAAVLIPVLPLAAIPAADMGAGYADGLTDGPLPADGSLGALKLIVAELINNTNTVARMQVIDHTIDHIPAKKLSAAYTVTFAVANAMAEKVGSYFREYLGNGAPDAVLIAPQAPALPGFAGHAGLNRDAFVAAITIAIHESF